MIERSGWNRADYGIKHVLYSSLAFVSLDKNWAATQEPRVCLPCDRCVSVQGASQVSYYVKSRYVISQAVNTSCLQSVF